MKYIYSFLTGIFLGNAVVNYINGNIINAIFYGILIIAWSLYVIVIKMLWEKNN